MQLFQTLAAVVALAVTVQSAALPSTPDAEFEVARDVNDSVAARDNIWPAEAKKAKR
jgi:hypothetical protein